MIIRRSLILLLLLAALGAVGGVASGPAAAATPCWKLLLDDWLDGRIDKAYPASCYREAIKHLPEDVDAYSDAREDINRALLAAVRSKGGQAKNVKDTDVIPPAPGSGTTTTTDEEDPDDGGVAGTTTDGGAASPPAEDDGGGGLIEALEPSNADSIPVPLLVLAGLALLLLAAAAVGYATRRLQARRARVLPGPREP